MAELKLEPYAGHLYWRALAGIDGYPWERILAEHLEALAHRCEVGGQSVVGHIKGIATFDDGNYLRASVVSPSHPADMGGRVPAGCTELIFTLNVLVYGLSYETISRLVQETAKDTAAAWDARVWVEEIDGDHHAAPHHHLLTG